MSKQTSKSVSMRPMHRSVADQFLLAIIDAHSSNLPANKKNDRLGYEKERERRLLAAKKALFGDTPQSGQPQLHDEVVLQWMAREHLHDRVLAHPHPALNRWSTDPPPKERSVRELAKQGARLGDGYSEASDMERFRRKFQAHKNDYLDVARYNDDIDDTFEAQSLLSLKESLKRIGIESSLPSQVEKVKQQVAPKQEIDWLEIEQRFTLLSGDLGPMYLPSKDERRAYRPSRCDPFDWGAWTYPGSKERQARIQEFNKDVGELDEVLETIRKAIASSIISADFLLSWGYLNMIVGRHDELLEQEDQAKREFERGLSAGETQRKDDQRRWVARRLMEATNGDKSKLRKAKIDLRVLIDDIKNKKCEPPSGYPHKVSLRIVERINWNDIKKLAQA